MWYDRRTASPLEPLSPRTMASKRRLFEMRLACLGGGLVLALSLSSGCSHTEDSVGFVLEKHGEWYLEKAPSKTLSEGQEIPAGAKIRPKEEGQEGEKCLLTICLYTGQAKVYKGSKGSATLPARPDPSSVNRLCRAIAGRYSGGYIHALSRGKEISDGVVPQFLFRKFGGGSRAARRVKFPPANRSWRGAGGRDLRPKCHLPCSAEKLGELGDPGFQARLFWKRLWHFFLVADPP